MNQPKNEHSFKEGPCVFDFKTMCKFKQMFNAPKKFDITSGADYKGISYFPTKKPFVTFIKLFTRYS